MTTTRAGTPPAQKSFDPALRRLMITVVLGVIMTILDTTIVSVAIDSIGRDFHTSLSTIQWTITGYTLALSMTIPITSWAVGRFGAKTVWLTSLVLFIAGSVLCGVAWSVGSLIVFRVIQGVGGGIIMPVGQTMLAKAAGPNRMGRVMAMIAVPAMAGPALGPVLGGLIVDHLAWRWLFYVNVPFCVIALLLSVRWLPSDTERTSTRLDTLGLALLSPGLAALVYGLSEAGNGSGLGSARVLIGLGVGAVLVVAFVVRALRKADGPLIDVRMFRHRAFTSATGALFVYSGAMFGLIVMLPLYFQIARGESPMRAGLLVAPFGLGAMITSLVGGRVADRIGARIPAVAGILLVVAASLVYTRIQTDTATGLLIGAALVAGLGHGLIVGPLMGGLYKGVPKAAVSSATTSANILVRVGSAFGSALLAVVLQTYIRAEIPGASGSLSDVAKLHSPQAVAHLVEAFGDSFWWTVGLALVALVPALLIPRRR